MKTNRLKICICGGGSQGHISAGVIGSNTEYEVNILTRRPKQWSHHFVTMDLTGKEYHSSLNIISDNPEDVIPQADIILICLPGFAIRSELELIYPYISKQAIIGCVFGGSGFFLQLIEVFGLEAKGFALQRVPFTGRPKVYGHSATLKGYKPYLKVATMNIETPEKIVRILEEWYSTPVYLLKHWLEATLSNSNPLLHPCRMKIMFKDWTPNKIYARIPYMYNTDWDDESSKCWVDCDLELRKIMDKLPMDINEVPSILDYYNCEDIAALTSKMQSIEPFKTVKVHMIEVSDGYKVDASVRYFTEDIPYGMLLIKAFAELTNTATPSIDSVIEWAQNIMGQHFISNGHLIESTLLGELSFLLPERLRTFIQVSRLPNL